MIFPVCGPLNRNEEKLHLNPQKPQACKGFFAAKVEKNCLNFITVHAACSDKIPYLRRLLN